MKSRIKRVSSLSSQGFTLIEVLVSLLIATILIGSAMALVGVSMKNVRHMDRIRTASPILDAAAQEIIRDPSKALTTPIILKDFPGEPSVSVEVQPVEDPAVTAKLYRITLHYGGETLAFSIIVSEKAQTP
ncbi:MAG: prepilin-type N-terminal cleavage/methylation domain-containing protein [Thermodesulforhabdaceae bacterium]|jgi:prepilin-type N-terminal cleavage/methylation domain-containing protein